MLRGLASLGLLTPRLEATVFECVTGPGVADVVKVAAIAVMAKESCSLRVNIY